MGSMYKQSSELMFTSKMMEINADCSKFGIEIDPVMSDNVFMLPKMMPCFTSFLNHSMLEKKSAGIFNQLM
jgi:hypothetical protein